MPKITVILPVFNSEKYVGAAIESILRQTYTDYEFLILDDGSIDSSLSVIESFHDPRIRVIKKINSGLADTLNYGIKISNGELIARMDNDDISLPNRLQVQMQSFRKGTAVLGGQIDILDSNCKLHKGPRFPSKPKDILKRLSSGRSAIIHPTVLINRELLLKVGCYDDRSSAEDADLWLRMSKLGRLENIKNVVLHLRKHDKSMTVLMRESHIIDHLIAVCYFRKYSRYEKISENQYDELLKKAKEILRQELFIPKYELFVRQKNDLLKGNIFHQFKYLMLNPSFFRLYWNIVKMRKKMYSIS
jgi:glycosyltransferase involved in cell wall biosynthesis